ncbi:hypothetical protein N665_0004s0059 [Sinapis alba]|nr:hypothetical protein N665_0004s0059 [Sinapis alba]
MANVGVDTRMTRTRQKSRRIGSKARSHEESYSKTEERFYLHFIKIETKRVPNSTPGSSSLTRRYFDRLLDSKCFNGVTLDQLFVRVGAHNKLLWNNNWSEGGDGVVCFFSVPAEKKKWHSRWSPLGSFFVTSYYNMVIIWGSRYYRDFGRLMRFNHHQVEQFDLSPGEKYLVTYSRPEPSDSNGLWLKIFDVRTGTGIVGLNGGVADSPPMAFMIIDMVKTFPRRWAGGKDDKYFATLNKNNNTISVYETETFNQTPLNLDDDVVDISWSPTESVLAVLLKGGGGGKQPPVKALLLRIPDKVKLAEKDLGGISNGEYLAVKTHSGFEFFRIKEEGMPTDFLKVDKKKSLVAFAWEPSGHRFAVIYGGDEEPNLSSVSFYSMKKKKKVTELITLCNRQADALFWSPRGNVIVVAGLKVCFDGKLEFYDADQLQLITTVRHPKANRVVWNPSGRYVATVFTIPPQEEEFCYSEPDEPLDRFNIWSSHGHLLYVHQCDSPLMQLDWRPYGGIIIDDDMQKNPFEDSSK